MSEYSRRIVPGVIAAILVTALVAVELNVIYGPTNSETLSKHERRVASSPDTITPLSSTANDCGFVLKCSLIDSSGLELSISINSTAIKTGGAIAINVTETNTLNVDNNISGSSLYRIHGLTWLCGSGYLPHGIGIFRGHYLLTNITSATPLDFWAHVGCPVDYILDGTHILGILDNVTGYAFRPNSDSGYYSAYYRPVECSPGCTISNSTMFGTFPMTGTSRAFSVYATDSATMLESSLLSDAPSTYTLVAGDEWGNTVFLHFQVVS